MASEILMKVKGAICMVVIAATTALGANTIATIDDLPLGPQSYWNGSDSSGGFKSGSAYFHNNYDTKYGSWDGFAYSNISDVNASGWTAQFNAITGTGQGDSPNYAIGYVGWIELPTIILDTPVEINGLYVTNNNYAYYSMLNGDFFAKKFGGQTGNDPDWFKLTITGRDSNGNITGSVDFYLADYRFEDNSQDYIVDTWEYADLSSLGAVKSLEFNLSSSDTGKWGMNTPAYFAIDTIVAKPTPLELAIEKIETAIASKTEAIGKIDAAIAQERQAIEALNTILKNKQLKGTKRADTIKARERIQLAILHQRLSKTALLKSIEKLEDSLDILEGKDIQKNNK